MPCHATPRHELQHVHPAACESSFASLFMSRQIPAPFKVRSNAAPSLYAYPAPIELKTEEKKVEKKKATLSVTAKAAARQKRKEGDEMEVESEEKVSGSMSCAWLR